MDGTRFETGDKSAAQHIRQRRDAVFQPYRARVDTDERSFSLLVESPGCNDDNELRALTFRDTCQLQPVHAARNTHVGENLRPLSRRSSVRAQKPVEFLKMEWRKTWVIVEENRLLH